MNEVARLSRLVVLVVVLAGLTLQNGYARLEVFATFEEASDVASVSASQGIRYAASERFPAWGKNSLEVVFPEAGGSIRLSDLPEDWRRQGSLLVFVWSQQPSKLTIRLHDSAEHSFSKAFPLRAGVNHIQLPLKDIEGLDLGRMEHMTLEFGQAGTLYLDYFALDRFHPVLEERGRWDIDYSMKVETPHVPWGRNLSSGSIRTFALADVANGRGVIELAQRVDLTLKAVTLGRSPGINKWGFGDFYRQRSLGGEFWSSAYSLAFAYIADALLHGPEYDVILWPGLHSWESYPEEIRTEVRRRVEAGTGLVLFYPLTSSTESAGLGEIAPLVVAEKRGGEFGLAVPPLDQTEWRPTNEHYITRGVPFEAFPWGHLGVAESQVRGEVLLETSRGTPVMATRQIGKGRVVAFAYPEKGMIPQIDDVFETGLHYPYHEYLWSLVARAVVWASRHEPEAAILGVEHDQKRVAVDLLNPPSGAIIEATVGSSYGETERQISTSLVNGDTRVELMLPQPLSGGRHFVDLRLIQGAQVHDWMSFVLEADSQVKITALVSETDRVSVGNPVSVRVNLTSPLKTNATVTVRLFDNYDRLIDEQEADLLMGHETTHSVTLDSTGVLTHLARLDCEVAVNGHRNDRKIEEVFVIQPRKWDDYDIVMYRFGPDPIPGIWPAIDSQMRRLNVTTLSSYSLSHSKHANYDIQAQTRISGQESPDGSSRDYYKAMKKEYAQTRDRHVLSREFCMNDPSYHELVRKEIREKASDWAPFSPLSYYVYEEPSLTCYVDDLDLCFSPHCMAAMREWLKVEYGSVQALNERWGTAFQAWQEVQPDDTYAAQSRGNYVSWSDHRTFMEITYAKFFAFVLEELRQVDPEGMLLNSGTQESGAHNGCDYSRINYYTRHLNAYDGGNQLDFHRSFNPDIKMSSGAGYGVLGKDVFYDFYSNLFKGSNGGAYIFWQYSTLDPDLTMSQSGKDMEEGFHELRGQGIGKLVGLATSDNHGIAIHYSYPSIHAAWIVDGTIEEEVNYEPSSETMRRFDANRDGWVKILRDSGLQFDFISYGDIEKGMLRSRGYRALVLPMSLALSDKEVEAIRGFVSRGGIVIADALAGVMDDRSGFRNARSMAEVFGIETAPVDTRTIIALEGEPELKLRGAVAHSEESGRPILLQNRFGKGQALLLNYFLDSYPEDKLEGRNQEALERMKKILSAAGISPKVRLTSLSGGSVSDCATYLFNSGSTQLYGLVPDKGKEGNQSIRIALGEDKTVYDVRRKRFVTSGSSFVEEIEPAIPRLFAFVDGKVSELHIDAPAAVKLGEEVRVDFRVGGVEDYRSVATVVVTDSKGREVPYYGGNTDIIGSAGTHSYRTALNDVAGPWRIVVTDTITGIAGEVTIHVEADE